MAAISGTGLVGLYEQADSTGRLDSYRARKWARREEFREWLEQGALPSLEEAQALALYRASGGRQSREFLANGIEELRDAFDFLLYDTIKLEGRFDECAGSQGAYKLLGAGKEFASYLLSVREPALFGVWNANGERLLRRADAYPEAMTRGPIGIRYLDFLEALDRLRNRLGFRDFGQVDELAYLLARDSKKRKEAHGLAGYP